MRKRTGFTFSRQLILLVMVLGGWHCLWALDPQKTVDQYLLDQWETADGIPADSVSAINQTADGYLWIGTSRGLVRFDGHKFVLAPFGEKGKIKAQEIQCLYVDRAGLLWIGSSRGLTSYRYRTGEFKAFGANDGITLDGIRRIREDLDGNLWISFTTQYVGRFSGGRFTAFNASHGLTGKKINAMIEENRGQLLFGSREDGVFTYEEEKFSPYPIPGLDHAQVITMFRDSAADLWIGTNGGLLRVTGRGAEMYTRENGLTADYITGIIEDSDRNLWVGTSAGLNRVKRRSTGALVFDGLLKSQVIMYLFEDREKSLWVGTDSSGIKQLKDGKFTLYEPMEAFPGEVSLSLFADRHGYIWIGTASGKLFCFLAGKFIASITPPGLPGTGITAIAEDDRSNMWLGTTGKGVFQKRGNTFVQWTTREGLADNVINSITPDTHGNLWFSTFDGVSRLHTQSGTIESLKSTDGLPGRVVHTVYEDRDGHIWIAADKGITVLENGEWPGKTLENYLPGIPITCIHEDLTVAGTGERVFWIATDGAGLKRLSPRDKRVVSFTAAQGMTSDFIYQFLEDRLGNFWLMSDNGILRLDKNELNALTTSGLDKINCTSFGISDGMQSQEFDNKFSRNAALQTGAGEFFFITKKGIAIIDPGKIRINQTPPPVLIEAVQFNDRTIPIFVETGPFAFKGKGNISFYFTAPTFLSPEKARFKYQLDGFDQDWVFLVPGRACVAHYQDLAPGNYTFRVIAANADGVWNQAGASLAFRLESLFYRTFLFKLVALLLSMALAVAGLYLYKKYVAQKKLKYKDVPLAPGFAGTCIEKLQELMQKERLYLDADISLQTLADRMAISPHLLSRLLNEELDHNFADFINGYRIDEAIKILQGPHGVQKKVSAVAIAVGFNTMAAFYKAFKKHTGRTPSSFQQTPRDTR